MRCRWPAPLALLIAGCFTKPAAPIGDPDGGHDMADDAAEANRPRLIANAYWNDSTGGTPLMSVTGYSIPTTGIEDGDLVLLIGNLDNGDDNAWQLPPNFARMYEKFYGNDGQTLVVASRIAQSEPSVYSGTYRGTNIHSAAAVLSLVAIRHPGTLDFVGFASRGTPGSRDVVGQSGGLKITVADSTLLYIAGADWEAIDGSNTVVVPAGFTSLAAFGDKGDDRWQWSAQMIAYRMHVPIGPTGAITGELKSVGTHTGLAGGALIAIPPAP